MHTVYGKTRHLSLLLGVRKQASLDTPFESRRRRRALGGECCVRLRASLPLGVGRAQRRHQLLLRALEPPRHRACVARHHRQDMRVGGAAPGKTRGSFNPGSRLTCGHGEAR